MATIESFSPDPADAVNGTWSTTVELPDTVKRVRFVMLAADNTPTRLPSRIKISADQPGMPGGVITIAGIAAGVVLLGILAFVFLRRRAKTPAVA